jgi:uncharacterized membrane protein YfhO
MVRGVLHSKVLGPLVIVLFVLLANSLYLTGIFNPNPINRQSGLLSQSSRLVGGLDTIDPNDGITTQALGHASAEMILHGNVPWWDYNEEVGAPLAGGMQSAALFPLTLLLALTNGVLFFHIVLEMIAGLATYYVLKRLRCSEFASVTGGMLFAINGTFAWLGNAVVNPIAFLPLMVLGVEVAYDKAIHNQKRGWFLIALALALSLYAGFPEVAYLDGLFAVCWALVRLLQLKKGNWKLFAGKVVSGLVIGGALATPILVAFFDLTHDGYVGKHAGALAGVSLPAGSGLPALVFPYLYGPIFAVTRYNPSGVLTAWWGSVGGYVTLSLILLALIGLVSKGNRYVKGLLAGWIVVMIARTYGFPGLYHVLDLLPGMTATAVYRYVQPSFELAFVILAAWGLDRLSHGPKFSRRQILSVSGIWLIIAVTAIIMAVVSQRLTTAPYHWLLIGGSIGWMLVVVGIIVWSARSSLPYKKYIYTTVLIIDALLMFVVPDFSALHTAQLDTQPVTFLQKNLGNNRFYTLGPIVPNYGSFYNIASINTNNLPLPTNWANYITQSLDHDTIPSIFNGKYSTDPTTMSTKDALFAYLPAYRYTGVKYVVARKGQISLVEAKQNKLTLVFTSQKTVIYEIANPQSYFEVTNGGCRVMPISKSSVSVDCKQPSTLLRRELYMPGWTAEENGKHLPVTQSGPLFQSVPLPTGSYVVQFSFLPPYMTAATVLMLMSALVVTLAYVTSIRRFFAHAYRTVRHWMPRR